MSSIQSSSTVELPFAPPLVWQVVADLAAYPAWWPKSTQVKLLLATTELLGSRLEIRPYGGQPFVCEVVAVQAPHTLHMAYSGIYTGTGAWTLAESGHGTRVSYQIDLHIQSRLIRWLARFLPLAALHARLTEQILSALAQRVARLNGGAPPA